MAPFMNLKYKHILMDCRQGKVLNPHTCVYVKDCPSGFVRNDRFLCRKDKTKPVKPKTVKDKTNAVKPKTVKPKTNTVKPKTVKSKTVKSKTVKPKTVKLKTKEPIKSPKKMFNEDTAFVFYSKSAAAKPGMGKNEKIPEEKKDMYTELSAIPQWRQKLSNFWMQTFKLDGLHWASVEHYYQGSKFKAQHPDFYYQFSIESNSEISKSAVLAKSSGGKDVKHKYRPKDIKVDDDFFSGRAQKEMYKAQRAKFSHKDLQTMLKATKEANLLHYTRGGKLEQFMGLMQIRAQL